MVEKWGRNILLLLTLALPYQAVSHAEGTPTSREFMRVALQNNPSIKASIASIGSAEGNAVQAGLIPNPEAVFEMENFAGDGSYTGFDSAEFTMGVQQTIEMGGKRTYRTHVADHEVSRAHQEVMTQILAILSEVQFATVRYAVAQERLRFAQKRLDLANQTHNVVKVRVDAARDSEIEHTKVDIEKMVAEIEQNKARKELQIAEVQLSRLLGTELSGLVESDGVLKTLPTLPEQAMVLQSITHIPQSKILEFNKLRAEAAFDLANSQAIPDPTLGFGVRRFNDTDNTAFVATLTVPIPIFDRNQGGIQQARAELTKAKAERGAGLLSIREMALKTWEEFASALQEVKTYQKDIIPSAEKAYSQASEGFSAGRFSFLSLLDAQRTLYEVQETRLSALLTLHKAKANMDFLMNEHIDLVETALQTTEGKEG